MHSLLIYPVHRLVVSQCCNLGIVQKGQQCNSAEAPCIMSAAPTAPQGNGDPTCARGLKSPNNADTCCPPYCLTCDTGSCASQPGGYYEVRLPCYDLLLCRKQFYFKSDNLTYHTVLFVVRSYQNSAVIKAWWRKVSVVTLLKRHVS